ncbi:MAG: cupin domain-containing protein [Planctomycetota bacterium]
MKFRSAEIRECAFTMGTSQPVSIPGMTLIRSVPMNSQPTQPYATHLNILIPALSLVDVPALVKQVKDRWYNQTLCKVNDSVIRLGVMQGEYHWHKHDNDDEFFFVLDGHFIIDLEDRSIDLQAQQGFVVPKGIVHRTRAPQRAVILMVETAAIVPTGDV